MLTDQFPTCRFCEDPATRWRLRTVPEWGLDPLTGAAEKEEAALARWGEAGAPEGVYGTCDAHFYARHDEQGNTVVAVVSGRTRRLRKASGGQRHSKQRDTLIDNLGGKCDTCGGTDRTLLRIVWLPQVRPSEGTSSQWYQWLVDNPDALDQCVLRCVTHESPKRVAGSLRDNAVEAYGGACTVCGGTKVLWVVPEPGVAAPRYPGGRKMGSNDKLRWLAARGYPSGWTIRCPKHAA